MILYCTCDSDITYFMKHTDKRKTSVAPPPPCPMPQRPENLTTPLSALTLPARPPLSHFLALLNSAALQVAKIYTRIATLTNLQLLVRAGSSVNDVLKGSTQWRVGFGWAYVRALERSVNLEVRNYLVGGDDLML
jgi:origin recognition complex subunit 5